MNYYKNNIRHVKGDTFSSALVVEGLGQPLDSIFFTCRDSLNDDSNILFEKSLADGGITEVEYDEEHDIRKYAVRIDPYDTRTLQAGTYFYDIQISVNSDVFTIMKGNFILEQDATRKAEPVEPEIIIQIKAALDEINGEEISVNVFDKLDYLSETKGLIEDGLNDLGAEITEETTFRTYASKINDLYDEWPKETEEGTDFSITAKKGKMSLIPKGNTEQDTYTGKNLFDKETTNKLNAYINSTGTITSEVNNRTVYIPCKPNTTYTISKIASTRFGIASYNSTPVIGSTTSNFTRDNSATSLTIITGANDTHLVVWYYNETTDTLTEQEILNTIQIEEGSTATDYEPYVGGIPSPNPDYPQEYRYVTGDNTIKQGGKNLFDKDNANILNALVNGTTKIITAFNTCRTLYINCKSNTTYTISRTAGTRFIVGTTTNEPTTGITCNSISVNNEASSITITTGSNDNYLCVFYYNSGSDTLTEEQIRNSIQIEKGSTATSYEAYKTPVNYPLNLGTLKAYEDDYFYKNNDSWYLKNLSKEVTFNGSENWSTNSYGNNYYRYVLTVNDTISVINTSTEVYAKSNYFVGSSANEIVYTSFTQKNMVAVISNNRIMISTINSNLFEVNNFKTWLSTNNIKLVYKLETPTDTLIEDETLREQLEALNNAMATDGSNTISTECEEGNAPVIISASALMKGGN